jgi:predicted MPP superfamily phosphohydrolase
MRGQSYFLATVITGICLLLDLYVFEGVKTLCSSIHPSSSQLVYWFYWSFSLLILVVFNFQLYKFLTRRKLTLLFNTFFNAFLTFLVTKLVFALILLAGDFIRLLYAGGQYFVINGFQMPQRPMIIAQLALGIAAIPFFSFLFGITRGKYHYKVRRQTIYFKDLPESFDGFTITQISDIHAGSWDNPKAVQRGVDMIKAQGSDLFVFTGDLVNNQASEIIPWIHIFKEIKAPYGQFSVLGNHDYGDYIAWSSQEAKQKNLQNLMKYHAEIGFHLLLDEHVKIQKDGQHIYLLGVENWGKGFGQRGNLRKAVAGCHVSDFKLLLSHDPSHWDAEIKDHPAHIHLTLSGHTHGMQFGIEVLGFKWSPVKYRYPNWAGLAGENDRYLYVNRGFGFLGFSGRIGMWPEITVIQLKKRI